MDLSAVIFVVLAVAWAVYLIPRALRHHDDLASDRLVEGHSDKVRILSRHGKKATEAVPEQPLAPAAEPASPEGRVPSNPRAAARKAARNRRRVLYVLAFSLAVVSVLAWFLIVPWWTTAIPGGLILLFLVVARLSVRKAARSRVAPMVEEGRISAEESTSHTDQLTDEDTVGVPRQEIEAALADDGSLWDPLPVTLPTYVGKARARRTVRTIELTGINSSGHDESDSALAREAEGSSEPVEESETEQRKAAGA